MSSTQTIPEQATNNTSSPATFDQKLEVVVIPVSDVDRAKAFYEGLGWRLDIDFSLGDGCARSADDAARLALVDSFRQGDHAGGARFGQEHLPRRRRSRNRHEPSSSAAAPP